MSECVREMTLQEKAESIINLINHKDINAEYLYNWQIDAMKEMCEKQIPKKVIEYKVKNIKMGYVCPKCGRLYQTSLDLNVKHCDKCGQLLGEVEE